MWAVLSIPICLFIAYVCFKSAYNDIKENKRKEKVRDLYIKEVFEERQKTYPIIKK